MKKQTRFGNEYDGNSVPFQVRVFERSVREYHIPIGDVLDSQIDVEQAIAALYEAEEHDSVIMHLNCDGGSHNVGDSLLFAMQNCKADIHVIATGRIASYATFVLLSAHSFELSPFATILCHSASFGYAGKSQDTKEYVDFTYKQTEKMLRHYYEGFLTEGEIMRIIKERYEHLMDADEFVERFNKRNEIIHEKLKEGEEVVE